MVIESYRILKKIYNKCYTTISPDEFVYAETYRKHFVLLNNELFSKPICEIFYQEYS